MTSNDSENSIRIKPNLDGPIKNEHWITVLGPRLTDGEYRTWEVQRALETIFPDGDDRGTRIEIYRQPTVEEIEKLKQFAKEMDASFESEVRTDEQYNEWRRRERENTSPSW